MNNYSFKYGTTELPLTIHDGDILDMLIPKDISPIGDIGQKCMEVLAHPIGTPPLKDIVHRGEKIVIIVSDITRLWIRTEQFLIYIIQYLNDIGIHDEDISILISLGTHRPSSEEEKRQIVGKEVFSRISVYDHDCFHGQELCFLGHSSFGTPIYINKRVVEADRVILTGGITFHLFAGFGGGAKSIVPGVAGLETIQHNHRLTFYKGKSTGLNPNACSNRIHGNPMREDITEICRKLQPDFLLNAVLNQHGDFINFVAGDFEQAWLKGCDMIRDLYGIPINEKADIVIASAGGYPKDINLYQTVKTIDNSLYAGKDNSVLIITSECKEGLGAEEFLQWFQYRDLEGMERALKQNFTVPGYAAYKTAYAARFRKLILISSLPESTVCRLGFIPASSLEEALAIAYQQSSSHPKITLMPYGANTLPI